VSNRLIDRWLSGTADDREVAELRDLLQRDPTLLAKLHRAAERECDLYELFGGLPAINPETATARPRSTLRLAKRPARSERALRYLLPLAAGFVLLLLVPLLFARRPLSTEPQPVADAPAPRSAPTAPAPVKPAAQTPHAVPEPAPIVARSAPHPDADGTPTAPVPLVASVEPAPGTTASPAATAVAADPPPLVLAAGPRPRPIGKTDRVEGELKDESGALVMRYATRVPHTIGDQVKLGLVLCFHGAGGDERWMADPMLNALRASGLSDEFVVAALKSKGRDWNADDEGNVLAFIDWARRTWPIDPRRIVIQGVSNGGMMVNLFSSRHPELLAGVVTVCSGYGFEFPAKKPANAAETAPEYYVVHGTADEAVNVKGSRAATASLHSLGYRYVYREYPGAGHDVFGDEPTRRDFAHWLERLRHKTAPLAEDDRKTLATYATLPAAEKLIVSDEGAAPLLRIGGIHAERVLVRALRSPLPEARAAAAALLARTPCSPGVTEMLIPCLDDKAAAARVAALGTLTQAADWNDQEALVAVCRFAGGVMRVRERAERLAVVERLAQSLAYRSSLGASNQLICELFVHLLDDEDEGLRQAAISALARRNNDRFGYHADAPVAQRREAVARWRKWYLELFAPEPQKPAP
jgi:predicted esterase